MSEFRQDITSGDWVIIAPGRAKRPEELVKKKQPRKPAPRGTCPFEDLKMSGNWPPIAIWPILRGASAGAANGKNWKIAVVPNKYPALSRGDGCAMDGGSSMYPTKTGVGEHEIVVTRDHVKNFAEVPRATARKLFEVFQARHRSFAENRCLSYASTFFNWGPSAGASLSHPHYQILALPIVPPHIAHSLAGSEAYFKRNKRCVRCDIITAEKKNKKRIIAENAHAIAFAPFASKHPFEVSIFPKRHLPSFGHTSAAIAAGVADLLQDVLRSMKKKLNDPDLNFFIHGAPLDYKRYPHHHWHVEVVPVNVVSPPGGFESSTEVIINVIDPDDAAKVLRR